MNLKKNLLVLVVALFTLGFVACSDDDDVLPAEAIVSTWSLSATTSDITAGAETTEAIEKELERSTFSIKSLTLNEDGSYESTLNSFDKGVYKFANDSLYLIKAEEYTTATPSTQSFGLVIDASNKMELTEDITDRFVDRFEDVEKVTVTLTLDKSVEQ